MLYNIYNALYFTQYGTCLYTKLAVFFKVPRLAVFLKINCILYARADYLVLLFNAYLRSCCVLCDRLVTTVV